MAHGIENALDVRVKHPVHLLPVYPGVERIERIMLAAPRSESIREAEEVFLVDRVEQRDRCPLDDLVLKGSNRERALPTIRLGNVLSP